MRTLRPIGLLLLIALAAGCSQRDLNRYRRTEDRWNDDWNQRQWENDDCRKGRGRVNMKKWRERVDDFEERGYKNKKNFQNAKQDLLSGLASERDRACPWEQRQIDDMMAEVRNQRW